MTISLGLLYDLTFGTWIVHVHQRSIHQLNYSQTKTSNVFFPFPFLPPNPHFHLNSTSILYPSLQSTHSLPLFSTQNNLHPTSFPSFPSTSSLPTTTFKLRIHAPFPTTLYSSSLTSQNVPFFKLAFSSTRCADSFVLFCHWLTTVPLQGSLGGNGSVYLGRVSVIRAYDEAEEGCLDWEVGVRLLGVRFLAAIGGGCWEL